MIFIKLHKNWSFLQIIFSVNATKSTGNFVDFQVHLTLPLVKPNNSRTIFFSSVVNESNKIRPDICGFSSYSLFRKSLLKFIRYVERLIYHINNSVETKLLTRLRLNFLLLRCVMSQNVQTHLKNVAANAARFLKCVWPFWDIIYSRVKTK